MQNESRPWLSVTKASERVEAQWIGLPSDARGVQHGDEFGVTGRLHAEGAADVVGDKVQFLRLEIHRRRDLAAHAGHTLRRAAQREALAARVIARGGGARLERGDDQPLVDQFDLHHMRGFGEGALERGLLLAVGIGRRAPVEADIARRFRPKLRCAGLDRLAHIGDRGERLIVDRDLLGAVLRGGEAGRDDHRDRLADMHHARRGERRTMRRERRLAIAAGNWMRVRERVVVLGGKVGGREHRQHPLHLLGFRRVDVLDLGKAVRRTDELREQRALRLDVVAEAAGPAQQRIVLDAAMPLLRGVRTGHSGHSKKYLKGGF